ncbi:hypothetical protein CK203_010963 [Vitis vinifera]|uniref:Protein nuclear fusion defective 6, chloroplastic/mitochondrial n=1 Tax=Vitis vinifera TaxID=29760 RepID=A0A438JIV8_VITVI|nr:hypothetical protein CK203_067273 [Vitis vinifera]RVX08887.1 hypothetical protein CK203_010963 [Vitis vinifera]
MASSSARRFLQRSSSTTRAYLSRNQRPPTSPSVVSAPSSLAGVASSQSTPAARFSRLKYPSCSSRLPVELASTVSMMPLHSATASALLNSMLSSKVGSWGWLSEGT